MKKSTKIWIRINGKRKLLIYAVIGFFYLLVSYVWLNEVVTTFLFECFSRDYEIAAVSIGSCFLIFMSLICLSARDIKNLHGISQLLNLSKIDIFVYEAINISFFGVLGMGLVLSFVNLTETILLPLIIIAFICLYAVSVWIGISISESLLLFKPKQRTFSKKVVSVNSYKVEAICLNLFQKIRNYDVTVTIAFITLLYLFVTLLLKKNYIYVHLGTIVLISLGMDKTFESEGKTIGNYILLRITKRDYLVVQLISTYIYGCLGVAIISFIYNSVWNIIMGFVLSLFIVLFWTITYIDMELNMSNSLIKKILIELISIPLCLTPIINVGILYKRNKRIEEKW